jgi:hypothetical protein
LNNSNLWTVCDTTTRSGCQRSKVTCVFGSAAEWAEQRMLYYTWQNPLAIYSVLFMIRSVRYITRQIPLNTRNEHMHPRNELLFTCTYNTQVSIYKTRLHRYTDALKHAHSQRTHLRTYGAGVGPSHAKAAGRVASCAYKRRGHTPAPKKYSQRELKCGSNLTKEMPHYASAPRTTP